MLIIFPTPTDVWPSAVNAVASRDTVNSPRIISIRGGSKSIRLVCLTK